MRKLDNRVAVIAGTAVATGRATAIRLAGGGAAPLMRRIFLRGSLAAFLLLAGCTSETLLQSNFDSTPDSQPPSHVQKVGTANAFGPPGSVVVIEPPVTPSGKWVQITRSNGPDVAGLQGVFSQFRGDGEYTFSTTLYIPSGSGIATIQFERFNQQVSDLSSFMHLDFTGDNRVRIDDNDATTFGSFPRNQVFIVQVTLNINASSPTARIVLSGAGASGQKDYNINPALISFARQFGAVRVWMGFPWTGSFDATNIVVTRNTQ
jgi:hypothetical protein